MNPTTALTACTKLGLRTTYIGSFGSDPLGTMSRQSLVDAGVDVSGARTVAGATNQFAVILVDARKGVLPQTKRHLALANLLNASPNGKAEADAEFAEVRALDPHLLPAPPPTAVVPAAPAPGAAPPAEAAVTPPSAPGGTHKLKPINRKFKLTHDSAVYQAADSSTSVVGQVHHGHFVHVTGIQGSWLQITLRNGTVGFIPVSAAE